jgi:hypothetical protein
MLAYGAAAHRLHPLFCCLQYVHDDGKAQSGWWEYVVIACSSFSAACGLAVLAFQLARAVCQSGAAGSSLGVLASLAGTTTHVGMLAAFTIYMAVYWDSAFTPASSHNAFDYFGSWGARWQAMYIFGVCGGALAWVLALAAGVADMRLAQRRYNSVAPSALPIDDFVVAEGSKGSKGLQGPRGSICAV